MVQSRPPAVPVATRLGKPLKRGFFARQVLEGAPDLIGATMLVNGVGGIIVEVEAYLGPHDLAAHSAKGLTPRTKTMFGPPGHAYVYLIYGIYHCMNVVTQPEGVASAVLLRALEPVKNVDGRTQGPGLLCRAMHIDKRDNGCDLLSDDFYIRDDGSHRPISIVKRPRIGVDYARHWARRLASRADCTAGSKSAISTAMIAMTTSSSMSVKPRRIRIMIWTPE